MSAQIMFISGEQDQDICPSCATHGPVLMGYIAPDSDFKFNGDVELFQQHLKATGFIVEGDDMFSQVNICRNADCRTITVVVQSEAVVEADQVVQLNLK